MPIEEKSWQKYDIIPSNVEILRYFIGSLTFFCLFLYLHLLHSPVISVRANAENGLRYTFLGTEKHPCEMGSADHPFPNNQPASQASTLLFCLTGNLHKGGKRSRRGGRQLFTEQTKPSVSKANAHKNNVISFPKNTISPRQDMEKFEVNILGCGSALPTMRHQMTSQVVNLREKLFMIDCAEGTQLQMRRQNLSFSRLGHVFISHLHGDHCLGLTGMISTFSLLGRVAPLHIYSPGDDLERLLRPHLDFFCHGISFDVIFHSFSPCQSEVIYDDRTVSVRTLPLRHRMPCCGFLFSEKPTLPHIRREMIDFLKIPYYAINAIKSGAGWTDVDGREWKHEELVFAADAPRRYAYCSDTMPVDGNIPLLEDVDVLFHEATFSNDAASRAKETGHSTAAQAAEMAKKCHAKRLIIGHFSSRYPDETVLKDEASLIFPHVVLAKEGLKIEV